MVKRQFTQVVSSIGVELRAALPIPAQGPMASARASGIDLGALMTKALDNVHSFEVMRDSTIAHATTSPDDVMKMHVEEIFVRRGAGFVMSLQMTRDRKYSAEDFTGTHLCIKRAASAAWNCALSPSYVKSMTGNFDPAKAFAGSGVVTSSVFSAGTKSMYGELCTGYR